MNTQQEIVYEIPVEGGHIAMTKKPYLDLAVLRTNQFHAAKWISATLSDKYGVTITNPDTGEVAKPEDMPVPTYADDIDRYIGEVSGMMVKVGPAEVAICIKCYAEKAKRHALMDDDFLYALNDAILDSPPDEELDAMFEKGIENFPPQVIQLHEPLAGSLFTMRKCYACGCEVETYL